MSLPEQQMRTADAPFVENPARRLMQDHKSSARWLQIILDQVLVVVLLYAHTLSKGLLFDADYRILALLAILLMSVAYQSVGVYQFTISLADRCLNLAKAWVVVLLLIVLFGFITKTSATYSREVILTWSVTSYIAQCLAYIFVGAMQSRAKEEMIPTLLIGARELGEHLATHLNGNKWIPDQVVGVIEDCDLQKKQWPLKDIPILGNLDDLGPIIRDHGIRRVYIALPMQQSSLIKPLYLNLMESNIDVLWAPDIFGINLLNHSVREVAGIPIISLSETPLIGTSAFLKSLMDYSIAGVALIFASPLMLFTALLIKLTSPGPILFTQARHGWDGRILSVFKFRSMQLHEEEAEYQQARKTTTG